MAKKKRSEKAPAPPAQSYVRSVDIFAAFVDAARSIGAEVMARRAFADELAIYLAEKGLHAEFEAWRKARAEAPRG